jgi:phosphoribosylglycinamide formyltransferase-1
MQSIIIFASGAGSNAKAIIDYFKEKPMATVALIVCNKPEAGVIKIAESANIPVLLINKQTISSEDFLVALQKHQPSLLVLAGFLWKIPELIVKNFKDKIINIHPALLPKYGGKNMYGSHVHQAVIAAKETESGITIHYVNEVYDEGRIIVQARCEVAKEDDEHSLAGKIHQLEHFYFPKVIEFLLR